MNSEEESQLKKGISPYEEEHIFDPDNEWVKLAHAIS